jgi:phosphatidate cytidylyltransferase
MPSRSAYSGKPASNLLENKEITIVLKQRMITAAILLPLVIASLLYLPVISLLLVVAGFFLIAASEWLNIINQVNTKLSRIIQFSQICVVSLLFYFIYWFKLEQQVINLVSILWLYSAIIIYIRAIQLRAILSCKHFATFLGFFLLGTAWMAFKAIYFEYGKSELLYLGALVCGADISAYFVGKKYGKHQLAPNISPGKTKEGALGAVIFVVIIALIRQIFSVDVSAYNFIVGICMAIAITIISIVGDLSESMLKRIYNVKDSSSLLPGHGGMLDRLDSLIAALPVYYSLLYVSARYVHVG